MGSHGFVRLVDAALGLGLKEDPITRGLRDCRLLTGTPALVTVGLNKIQGGFQQRHRAEVLRPAPGKLLVFEHWKTVPEWIVQEVIGFNEYTLGFEAVKYRIPALFQARTEYDLLNDRTIVFEPLPDPGCPCSVIDFYAQQLSDSDPRYEFCELDGNLVAMVSSSILSDNAQHICYRGIHHYSERCPTRPRYVMTGSASAHAVKRGCKLRIPESFVIENDEYVNMIEEQKLTGRVLPPKIQAAVVIEQLSAFDDINATIRKCQEYIEIDQCTSTVILLADVYSTRHKKKYDEVHKFMLVGGAVKHQTYVRPKFVDLDPGVPGCRIYLSYTASKFEHSRKLRDEPVSRLVQLLCDAVCASNLEDVKMLTCGLSSINVCDSVGRLPLVEACKVGNEDVVKWLLQEGGDIELQDGRGIWPALVADSHIMPLVHSTRSFGVEDLIQATVSRNEELLSALVNAGADPCASNADGLVPLIEAVRVKVPLATFRILVEKSKDLSVEDDEGMTALTCAKKRKGRSDYEQVLVDAQKRRLGTATSMYQ